MILINANDVTICPQEALRAIDELAWQARRTGQSWRTVAIVDALAQHVQVAADAERERETLQDEIDSLKENLADARFQIGKGLETLRGVAGCLDGINDKHAARAMSSINSVVEKLKHLAPDST